MRHTRATIATLAVLAVGGLSACGAGAATSGSSAAGRAANVPAQAATHTGASPSPTSGVGAGRSAPSGSAGGGGLGSAVAPAQARIIETGTVELRVGNGDDLRRAFAALMKLITSDGGFVASSSLQAGRQPSATITLRVPEPVAAEAMSTIGGGRFGKVTASSLSGQDVTGQVVQLGVEIANLTSEEKAVRVLLGRAVSVSNILTIQQQLFQLQGQIQELTAQSNSLDNLVEFATLTVDLTTPPPAPPVVAHPSTLARFWHLAVSHSVAFLRGFVLAIGWSAPLLILLGIAAAGFLGWRRRRRAPPAAPGPASP